MIVHLKRFGIETKAEMYLEDLQTNKRNVDDKLTNRTRRLKRETNYQGICGSQIYKYKKVEDTQKDEGKEMQNIQTHER